MAFLLRPTQEFRVPVIDTSTRRLRIPSLITTTNFVLFLLSLGYWAHFGNFLALEFAAGEPYSTAHWWKIWASAPKIFYIAYVAWVVGQLRTQSPNGLLSLAMLLTVLFALFDIICSIIFGAITFTNCTDPVCYLNAGVTPPTVPFTTRQAPTFQFQFLLGLTIGEAVVEIIIFALLNQLSTNVTQRMDIRDSVEQVQDLVGEPATVRGIALPGLTQRGFGPGQQSISQLSPAAQQSFVSQEEAQSLLANEAARQSLADVLVKTQNLTNLATAIELAFFLLSLIYVGYLGNFLALEFDANEPYSSFQWWMLWVHGAKVFYMTFGFFTMGRAVLSRRTIYFTVLGLLSATFAIWSLLTFIVLFTDFTACTTRLCYGTAGNTGNPGEKSLAYWIMIIGSGASVVLEVIIAGSTFFIIPQVRARNTSIFFNESSTRLGGGEEIARRNTLQFGLQYFPTLGSQLDDDDAAASQSTADAKDNLFFIPEGDPRHAEYDARERSKQAAAAARAERERNAVQFLDADDASESSQLVGEQHLSADYRSASAGGSGRSQRSRRRRNGSGDGLLGWLSGSNRNAKSD